MDTPNIPEADRLAGYQLFESPIPLRLEPRDGARYPGFCRAPVFAADTGPALPPDDTLECEKLFDELLNTPPTRRRRDGGGVS